MIIIQNFYSTSLLVQKKHFISRLRIEVSRFKFGDFHNTLVVEEVVQHARVLPFVDPLGTGFFVLLRVQGLLFIFYYYYTFTKKTNYYFAPIPVHS